jgi:outer membrane protein assembly factor BamB
MCSESPCVNVIAGASRSVPYRLMISWVNPGEWETYQRDAGHRGYVPIVVRASRIAKIWEWCNPVYCYDAINPVATASGKVFVSTDTSGTLYALSEVSGAELWHQDLLDLPSLNPPAAAAGKVYVSATHSNQGALFAFETSSGAPVFQHEFSTQGQPTLAPTIDDGVVYLSSGYQGGVTDAYNADDGAWMWFAYQGDDDSTTPAVEDGKVYLYDETSGMGIYDSANGNRITLIADPVAPEGTGSYTAAPMLGSPDHVIALSGNPGMGGRYLIDYSPVNNSVRWITAKRYGDAPAFKDGVIYATSNSPQSLDAIDESTGQVLWSWVPNPSDTWMLNNVVVTKNLVFVSTGLGTHAINLATRQSVWSTPVTGSMAISGNGTLYIVEGTGISTGRLLAFSLR